MSKEQLAKETAAEWLLDGGVENVEELLKSCLSNSHDKSYTKQKD